MSKLKDKQIEDLKNEVKYAYNRVQKKDYYQGMALGAVVASIIWIGLIFIF